MAKRHHVDFVATKDVKRPTRVAFTTKSGERVGFTARVPVKQRVEVSFVARNKPR